MMYPLKFEPIYKERIWGGRSLEKLFARQLPPGSVGESWDLSVYGNDVSRIANGVWQGRKLTDVLKAHGREILGSLGKDFSLLIKIIDANDKLSLQVHPADKIGSSNGKTEAWYIASAKEGAKIVYGLKKGVERKSLATAAGNGELLELIEYADVKAGDLVFVPAGTVHALLEGVVVYEVQQSSDTTYRLYDYDRLTPQGEKRELHLEDALQAIDFYATLSKDFSRPIACPYFSVKRISVKGEEELQLGERFMVVCALSGQGSIDYGGQKESVGAGETLLLPACLEAVKVCGEMECLVIR